MKMKTRILAGPVPYGLSRFEVQETIEGLSNRCAVFDHLEDAALFIAAPTMLAALENLFEHCAMVHKYWGENSNQREGAEAIKAARSAIAAARGEGK
jgi:hypothetical protein